MARDDSNRVDRLPGPVWRKSTASNPNGDCVELAAVDGGGVAIRDSKDPSRPALIYTRGEIAAFIRGVKDGEFDDLAV